MSYRYKDEIVLASPRGEKHEKIYSNKIAKARTIVFDSMKYIDQTIDVLITLRTFHSCHLLILLNLFKLTGRTRKRGNSKYSL